MRTILVVDDEPGIVEVLRLVLKEAGYRVLSAPHGQAALACLAQAPVDWAPSDVMMPQTDGRALCARIQADPTLRGIPVVLMSTTPSARKLDGRAYAALLPKPFALEEALQTVAHTLEALLVVPGAGTRKPGGEARIPTGEPFAGPAASRRFLTGRFVAVSASAPLRRGTTPDSTALQAAGFAQGGHGLYRRPRPDAARIVVDHPRRARPPTRSGHRDRGGAGERGGALPDRERASSAASGRSS